MNDWQATYSGGINTTAMLILLVNEGWRGTIVFADTGGEHPETYCYIDYFERTFLRPRGLELIRISPTTHPHLYSSDARKYASLEEYCRAYKIIPILSSRWCSIKFKREPMENYRLQFGLRGTILGMTADEPGRLRRDDPTVWYPLAERGITRQECIRIIARAGLEIPTRSNCFFCPGSSIGDLRRLYYDHPELYERACELEEIASQHAGRPVTLSMDGISLREKAARRWEGLAEMDFSRWMPCICSVG